MRIPGGPQLIIDPDYVHSVGQQVAQDAQNLIDSGADSVTQFHQTLTNINNNNFPVQLYSAFYQFIETHTKELTLLCQDRKKIGLALQDVKNAADDTEIQNMARFNPVPLTDSDGPQTYPIS